MAAPRPPWPYIAQCVMCGSVTADLRARGCCDELRFHPKEERCDALPCPGCRRLHHWTGSVDLARAPFAQIERDIRERLGALFPPLEAEAWLDLPQSLLGNAKPRALIHDKRGESVFRALERIEMRGAA